MSFAFPDCSRIFDSFERDKKYVNSLERIHPFHNFFYEETKTVSELYYIFEELEIENNEKVIKLVGFIGEFDLAKKLVKELNNQSKSTRFDFDKVNLMNKDKMEQILSGIKKEEK